MKTLLLVAVAAACLTAQPAQSADGFEDDFHIIDRDGDGALSWTEFKSRVMDILYFADLDNDGGLSPAEAPETVSRNWKEIDRNADGRVGSTELVAFHKRWFQRADVDSSGDLSLAEIKQG